MLEVKATRQDETVESLAAEVSFVTFVATQHDSGYNANMKLEWIHVFLAYSCETIH